MIAKKAGENYADDFAERDDRPLLDNATFLLRSGSIIANYTAALSALDKFHSVKVIINGSFYNQNKTDFGFMVRFSGFHHRCGAIAALNERRADEREKDNVDDADRHGHLFARLLRG